LDEKTVAWTSDRLSSAVIAQACRLSRLEDTFQVALMPDVHLGQHVPNGCVLASHARIYPEAVGRDIGCGLSAIQFDIPCESIPQSALVSILEQLKRSVPSLKQPRKLAPSNLPESCRADGLSDPSLMRAATRDGLLQLGTLGRGNHFLELEMDQNGKLWALVHSGSRSMGQTISDWHLRRTERSSDRLDPNEPLDYLLLDSDPGQAYLADMHWAMRYATESRLLMLNRIADLLESFAQASVIESSYIDSPHNFARIEEHFGHRLIVHRKSVNSAANGELGIIPGSMSSGSRIVIGRGNPESLCSSSHGAGRTMSRSEAFESLDVKRFKSMMGSVVYCKESANKLLDESPAAYRNLGDVMQAQRELVATRDSLRTILNYKSV
jgi:tRNA-splicing ligase RtcB